ncbi:AGENET DOMAIN (AGD)-CONTAINING P1-like protein, partial [Drosera capensis]
ARAKEDWVGVAKSGGWFKWTVLVWGKDWVSVDLKLLETSGLRIFLLQVDRIGTIVLKGVEIKSVDRNTKNFHLLIKSKRRRARVGSLLNAVGIRIQDQDKKEVIYYYEALLGTPGASTGSIYPENRSLGPDGYGAGFFKPSKKQDQAPVSTEPGTPLTIGNPQALTTTTPHHLRHHDTTTSMTATPKPFADYHLLFKKGTQVEVSLNEPGLVGSWYTATVLRPISYRTNLIHVRYHTLLSDDSKTDEEIPLEESVHAVNVRPVPPTGKERRKFRVDEDVDAFDEDGWWEGVIVGVLKGGKYEVYFRCSREQMVFGGSELRVHREWVKGEWVPPVSEEEEEEEVVVETRLTRSSARIELADEDQHRMHRCAAELCADEVATGTGADKTSGVSQSSNDINSRDSGLPTSKTRWWETRVIRKRKAEGAATEEKGKGKQRELQLRKKVVPLLEVARVQEHFEASGSFRFGCCAGYR